MTRPLTTALLALTLAVSVIGCSATDDPRRVKQGEVVAASYTAAVEGKPVHVMLPSGRANLTLGEATDEVSAALTDDGDPLVPGEGDLLVQVSWSLDGGVYGYDTNLDVVAPDVVLGEPGDVGLRLVAGEESIPLEGTGTLAPTESGRSARSLWVAVPDDASTWSFEVEYDGLVQTVDARSGEVEPSAAAPLYAALPRSDDGYCETDASPYAYCLLDHAIGYPYLAGVGWAPEGRTYAVLAPSVDGQRSVEMTLDGREPDAVLRETGSASYAFLVRPGQVGFSGTVDGSGS